MTDMALLAMMVGSVTLFGGGFVVWYALWHRKVESCFEAVPIDGRRSVHVLRPGGGAALDRRR
jgi:hypothetical protein